MLDQILYGVIAFLSLYCLLCGILLWRKLRAGVANRYLSYLLFYFSVSFAGTLVWLYLKCPDPGILSMKTSVGACFFAMCTAFYPIEAVFPKYLRGKRLIFLLGPFLTVLIISIVIRVKGIEQYSVESLSDIYSYCDTPQMWMRLLFALLPFYYSVFIIFMPFGVRKTVILPSWVYTYIYAAIGVFLLYMGIAFTGKHIFYLLYMLYLLVAISVLVFFILHRARDKQQVDAGLYTPLMKE